MKSLKKALAVLLCAVMFAGVMITGVSAVRPQEAADFAISGIEVSGKTATVAIENSGACKLVAAIYDPDTGRMLASGTKNIEANAGSAQVDIDTPSMPEFYIIKAFALGDDMSALCAEYESRLYTADFAGYCKVTFFLYEKTGDDMSFIPGASVTAEDGLCDSEGDGKWDDHTAVTGDGGTAVFYFKPGNYTVTASAPGYFGVTGNITVTEEGDLFGFSLIKDGGSDPGSQEQSSDGTGSEDGWVDARHLNFGSYPQTDVTADMGSVLDSKADNWKSYKYYSGTAANTSEYGTMTPGDYMLYCDVTYESEKYRGVTFSAYRPLVTSRSAGNENDSEQPKNGYTCGNIYWFKYEPVRWRVVNSGKGLLISDVILDSRAFSGFVKKVSGQYLNDKDGLANDWETSSLRAWLNDDFYRTAFTAAQQEQILTENGDKVFVMTEAEATNPVYFTSAFPRQVNGTDYAKCQGLKVYETGNSSWYLSSAGVSSLYTCAAYYDGGIDETSAACVTSTGVRPAIIISLPGRTAAPRVSAQAAQGTGIFDYSYSGCTAGSDYILLNVTGYGVGFDLTAANLEYIDQITADSAGKVSGRFIPRNNVSGSTTLLVGRFGSGTEARVITVTEETAGSPDDGIPDINIVNYKSTFPADYKSKLIFHTDIEAPKGYYIAWSTGDLGPVCTIDRAEQSEYHIKADLVRISDRAVVKSTQTEVVKVDTGLFAKIIAWFRQIFRMLPVYENNIKK